jgi:hypothetical protein
MATVYATPTDLTAWMAPTVIPANATQLLRTASLAIREATETAFYAADPTTGLPTDTVLLQAFNDATCAHAAALYTFSIDPLAGGTLESGVVESSVGIGTARITYADAAAALAAKGELVNGICLEASRILRQAGIVLGVPWIVG